MQYQLFDPETNSKLLFSSEILLGEYLAKQPRQKLKTIAVYKLMPLRTGQLVRIMNSYINNKVM